MNTKFSEYVIRQLAASGFCLIDHVIARELTHDLIWASVQNALGDITQARPKLEEFLGTLPRVAIVEVKFVGRDDWVICATRDVHDFQTRIRNVIGLEVVGVREYRPSAPSREIADAALTAAKEDEPPAHQCTARTAWFEERGLADPKLTKKPAPIPFSEFDRRGER